MGMKKKAAPKKVTAKKKTVVHKPVNHPRGEGGVAINRPSSVPKDVLANLETACRSGKWLVAIWRVQDGKVFLDRTATDFPKADLDLAMRLIVENVQEMKASTGSSLPQ